MFIFVFMLLMFVVYLTFRYYRGLLTKPTSMMDYCKIMLAVDVVEGIDQVAKKF